MTFIRHISLNIQLQLVQAYMTSIRLVLCKLRVFTTGSGSGEEYSGFIRKFQASGDLGKFKI